MATAWVQKHDFSAVELGELSKAELFAAFDKVDWRAELSRYNEDDPKACCAPGFGIILGANILHMCPNDANTMFFNLHYETETRFLFFIPMKRKKTHYVESYPLIHAHKLISHFMASDLRSIIGLPRQS